MPALPRHHRRGGSWLALPRSLDTARPDLLPNTPNRRAKRGTSTWPPHLHVSGDPAGAPVPAAADDNVGAFNSREFAQERVASASFREEVGEHTGVAELESLCSREQGHGLPAALLYEPVECRGTLRFLKLGAIAPDKLRKSIRFVAVPRAQFVRRSEITTPLVKRRCLSAQPARPQTIHEDPQTIISSRMIVDTAVPHLWRTVALMAHAATVVVATATSFCARPSSFSCHHDGRNRCPGMAHSAGALALAWAMISESPVQARGARRQTPNPSLAEGRTVAQST
jgi:hypothetical protein